ncbi:MAG: efflux RND transporter permease subunit, partial [Rhodospirillaceae bacterium]|nr:efflux RND transporter permease subunit [Rhodospirillaceae bacterium]
IKIAGPDLNVIRDIGVKIETIIGGVPGTSSVYSERVTGGRFININVDRRAAARFGLNVSDLQEVIRTAIGGTNVTYSVEGLQRYPINLRYPREVRDSVERLRMLPVVTPTGAQIPLGEVTTITVSDGPGVIKSENARPNGWVYIDISGRDLGSYVAEAQLAVAENINLPEGYALSWSGQYEYLERAQRRLTLVAPLTLAVIMLLLYLNFRKLGEVAIILGTLPLALTGGLWLIYLLDYNLSVAVGVGFIALAGVAVEIGVIMLVYLNQALQRHKDTATTEGRVLQQTDVRQAVIDGALLRVRPIIMTVTAIIAGLLPIMFGSGTGSEVMRRIAAPMVGGMVSATLLALIVLPAVFYIWKRRTL